MKTQIVNSGRDEDYLWASLAIFVVTMAVNAAAVVVIGKKEKTGVNQLIVFDCFANVLTALVQMVNMVYLSNWLFDCSGQIRKKNIGRSFWKQISKVFLISKISPNCATLTVVMVNLRCVTNYYYPDLVFKFQNNYFGGELREGLLS